MTDTINVLARWWNTLNDWEWPDDMPGKPDGFDEMRWYIPIATPNSLSNIMGLPKEKTRVEFINPVADAIELVIGKKECLRYHHINNLESTNDAFELWWNTHRDEL